MASKLNKVWHEQNPMPKNANLGQRVAWHIAHNEACACRQMPESIKEEIKKRKGKNLISR